MILLTNGKKKCLEVMGIGVFIKQYCLPDMNEICKLTVDLQ